MKSFLLIGLGRFGLHIAQQLASRGQEILAVDHREARVNEAMPFVTAARIGDATNPEFLQSLGVRNFDVCIVAIGNDFQSSLETTANLKELGAKFVVSQASREVQAKFLLANGADEILYPEKQLARWAAIRYGSNHILDFVEMDSEHGIFEVTVPKAWIGRSIGQIDIRRRYNINILAVKQNGKMDLGITADTVLTEDKTVMVLGEYRALQKCFHI